MSTVRVARGRSQELDLGVINGAQKPVLNLPRIRAKKRYIIELLLKINQIFQKIREKLTF